MKNRIGWQLRGGFSSASCPWCEGAGEIVDSPHQLSQLRQEFQKLKKRGTHSVLLSMNSLLVTGFADFMALACESGLEVEIWSCAHPCHRPLQSSLQSAWSQWNLPTFRLTSGLARERCFLEATFPSEQVQGLAIVWNQRRPHQTFRRLQQEKPGAFAFFPFSRRAEAEGKALWKFQQMGVQCSTKVHGVPGYEYRAPKPWRPLTHSQKITRQKSKNDIELSVIIPAHCRLQTLKRTFLSLTRQRVSFEFEVIVLDDGSPEPLSKILETPEGQRLVNLTYMRFEKNGNLSDGEYRAGCMRNLGAEVARGQFLSFLDADILVPPEYLEEVCQKLSASRTQACQAIRYDLEPDSSLPYIEDQGGGQVKVKNLDSYWFNFAASSKQWQCLEHHWKYVCTHSLSLRKDMFQELGGFRECFRDYGYEDVDFGYRFVKSGGHLQILDARVFHQPTEKELSGFSLSPWRRLKVLSRTGVLFYRNNYNEEVASHLRYLFEPRTSRVVKFKSLLDGLQTSFIR